MDTGAFRARLLDETIRFYLGVLFGRKVAAFAAGSLEFRQDVREEGKRKTF